VPLLVVPGLPGLIVFVVLLGSGYGVMTIARALLLADYVPADRYAGQGGLQAAVLTVGQIGAPVLGSVLRAAAGSYVPVFALVGVATAAAAACLVQADRAHQAVAATGPVTR
jgi:MFS family permease